jgi:copper chaperone CopZ
MKNRIVYTLVILFITAASFAKGVQKELKVHGDCMGCKVKIEDALDVKGITYADWNYETKILVIKFNDNKIEYKEIEALIKELGYKVEEVEQKEG